MVQSTYDKIGIGYAQHRRPDDRIATQIRQALGSARSVLNVGAGTGSYEPVDRVVVAVEPSVEMIRQRPRNSAPVVRAVADRLPFPDAQFDAALALLTIHHWPDWRQGLRELQRVARARVVMLTWDPEHPGFWLVRDYFPEILHVDRQIFPALSAMEEILGVVDVRHVPIPANCSDGFLGAYWRRPEMYLDAGARQAISAFAKLKSLDRGLERLRTDLANGRWEHRHQSLLSRSELDVGYRLVVASGGATNSGEQVR